MSYSSGELALSVRGIGKAYTISHNRTSRGDGGGSSRRHGLPSFRRQTKETFWALRDVSFDVRKGEMLGIIGRNGAGKSTLLKILSRITHPSNGDIDLYGRVGSLLEVGTGFHPELTGRENIFLNGTILGMRRREVQARFDSIVDFAGVERFLDTPVKRYSSGMYVRLAFAVAAHLEPEILIVDEVLAVGDAAFQQKCLGKMQSVSSEGRTVLLVSHNMGTITRLCPRALLLQEGSVVADGSAVEVARDYLSVGLGTVPERKWENLSTAPGNEVVRLKAVRVQAADGEVAAAVDIRAPICLEMEYEVMTGGRLLVPNFHLYNEEGVCVFIVNEHDREWQRRPRPAGHFLSRVLIPGNLLAEGTLLVSAAVSTMDPLTIHFWERDIVGFQVIDTHDGDSARGDYHGRMPGVVRPLLDWTTCYSPGHT